MRVRSSSRRPMKASRCLPALLALALAQSAQAGCQDAPGPRVNWTGCTRNLLMLGGDDLTEGVFSRANLASTDFRRANLARAKFDEAELSSARFENADLSGADLSKVVGWKANFARANLDHANLSAADLSRALFVEAKLAGANVRKAEVNRADFIRADLTGADLSKAEVARARHPPEQAGAEPSQRAPHQGRCERGRTGCGHRPPVPPAVCETPD